MEFWDFLREQIASKNTTQEWLAGKVGVHPVTFRKWMSKRIWPSASQAYAIAIALETTIEELVDGPAGLLYVKKIVSMRRDLRSEQLMVAEPEPAYRSQWKYQSLMEDLEVISPDVKDQFIAMVHGAAEAARAKIKHA